MRKCKHCHVEFLCGPRTKLYCSPSCSDKAADRRASLRKNPPVSGRCCICGAPFVRQGRGNPPKTCGNAACVKAHKNALRRSQNEKYRAQGKMAEWNRASYRRCNPDLEQRAAQRLCEREARHAERERQKILRDLEATMKDVRRRIMERDGLRDCTQCGYVGPVDKFTNHRIERICRACANAREARYRLRNPEKLRSWARAQNKRLKSNPAKLIPHRIRQLMQKAIARMARGETVKGGKWRYLGCTANEACAYMAQQFKSRMSWDNYGTAWHIDHVRPLASFDLTREDERKRAFHYTNLRPLWAKANMRKGARITVRVHQPELILCTSGCGS